MSTDDAAAEAATPRTPAKAAVGQMTATNDVEANYLTCAALVKEAAAAGCAILMLPECFAYIGVAGTDALKVMEPLDGPLMARYRQLAKEHNIWLSLGVRGGKDLRAHAGAKPPPVCIQVHRLPPSTS